LIFESMYIIGMTGGKNLDINLSITEYIN